MSENEMTNGDIDALLQAVDGDSSPAADRGTSEAEEDGEILGQDEINDLLGAISDDVPPAEEGSGEPEEPLPMIKIYDYIRPDFINANDVALINQKIENLSREISQKLSALSSGAIVLSVNSIDQLTLNEYIRSTPDPCTAAELILHTPEESRFFIEAGSQASKVLMALSMGIPPVNSVQQKITPLNTKIFASLVKMYLTPVLSKSFSIKEINTPQDMRLSTSLEPVIVASILMTDGTEDSCFSGTINLVLPRSALPYLFSETFTDYTVPIKSGFSANKESLPDTDLWFRRKIEFPISELTPRRLAEYIENGEIDVSNNQNGKVIYTAE